MAERKSGLAQASKLARRTSLAVQDSYLSELKAALEAGDWNTSVDQILNKPLNTAKISYDKGAEYSAVNNYLDEWFDIITDSTTNPLQEMMTFFWHTILTSDRNAPGNKYGLVAKQMNLFREKCLGNYYDLCESFMVDGLLIRYLNADSNRAKKPNENLAREVMELFTVGIGNYTEKDVTEAALALSGWQIDDDLNPYLNPERANTKPVTFLGETKRWDVKSITRRLCDHPATAQRIVEKLWFFIAGDSQAPKGLGKQWQENQLDIKWLVGTILKNDRVKNGDHYVRPKGGFEYYISAKKVLGFDGTETWRSLQLGQLPWDPPNVAGWYEGDDGDRWLDNSSTLARFSALRINYKEQPGLLDMTIDQILDSCHIYEISENTLGRIQSANEKNPQSLAQLRWWLALSSPEFYLT